MEKNNKRIFSLAIIFAMVLTLFSNIHFNVYAIEPITNFKVENNKVSFDITNAQKYEEVVHITLKTMDDKTLINRYTPYRPDGNVITMLKSGAQRKDLAYGKINLNGTGTYKYIISFYDKETGDLVNNVATRYIDYSIIDGKDVLTEVKLIDSINFTLEKPEAGTTNEEINVDLGGMGYTTGSNHPKLTTDEENIEIYSTEWICGDNASTEEEYYSLFEGTFEEGKAYYAMIDIGAKEGCMFPTDLDIKVNDKAPYKSDGVSFNEITSFVVKIYCGEEPAYVKGDINEDGKINADDAAEAIEIFKTNAQTAENKAKGDMNGDNKVDAEDAALIIEYFKTHK